EHERAGIAGAVRRLPLPIVGAVVERPLDERTQIRIETVAPRSGPRDRSGPSRRATVHPRLPFMEVWLRRGSVAVAVLAVDARIEGRAVVRPLAARRRGDPLFELLDVEALALH